MTAKGTKRSIGAVLSDLQREFPDVTISKIRFLESQGLIRPERSASGYRKFAEQDVDRLRYILRQQKENFLPLKVIRSRLDQTESTSSTGDEQVDDAGDGVMTVNGSMMLSRKELVARSGLSDAQLRELEGYGLLVGRRSGVTSWYGEDALKVARVAARYLQFGLDARHLRSLKTAADREAELYRQVVGPMRTQRSGQGQDEADATVDELCRLGETMRAELLRQALERE
jgi:DNA-binding transcriptional MerR regulator